MRKRVFGFILTALLGISVLTSCNSQNTSINKEIGSNIPSYTDTLSFFDIVYQNENNSANMLRFKEDGYCYYVSLDAASEGGYYYDKYMEYRKIDNLVILGNASYFILDNGNYLASITTGIHIYKRVN